MSRTIVPQETEAHRGRPSWDVLLMWKLLIVGKNYGNLSDEKLEEFGKRTLRVIRFAGKCLGFGPDAKTIHKYRAALGESGVMDEERLEILLWLQTSCTGFDRAQINL